MNWVLYHIATTFYSNVDATNSSTLFFTISTLWLLPYSFSNAKNFLNTVLIFCSRSFSPVIRSRIFLKRSTVYCYYWVPEYQKQASANAQYANYTYSVQLIHFHYVTLGYTQDSVD